VSGFTRPRALLYLSAFAVWLAAFVVILIAGGRVIVTSPGEAVLLACMFVACGVMGGIASLISREQEPAIPTGPVQPPGSPLTLLLSFGVRWVGLLIGLGIPAALRAI
jgi:hypothetical protein